MADRRKNRKNLIDQDSVNQLGSDLDKLKQNAESILDREAKVHGSSQLEDIVEEDLPEAEAEEDTDVRPRQLTHNLTTIKEDDGEEAGSGQKGLNGQQSLMSKSDVFLFKDDGKNAVTGATKGSMLKSPDTSIEPD